MGANIVRRLMRNGHTCVVYDTHADAVADLVNEGAIGAVDTFTKSLGTNPDLLRSKNGLALARVMKKEKIGDAESMVKGVLDRDAELSPPLKARAIAIQAHIANVATESDKAIALADQALGLNPEDRWALFAKANALAAKKDAAAPGVYTDLVTKQPSAPVFYFEGARNLQAAGMVDAAIALLDKYEAFFKQVKNQTTDGKEVSYLDRDDRYYLARGDVLKEANKLDEAMGPAFGRYSRFGYDASRRAARRPRRCLLILSLLLRE
jgi:tetratricopeptide (TPR) repeat protein